MSQYVTAVKGCRNIFTDGSFRWAEAWLLRWPAGMLVNFLVDLGFILYMVNWDPRYTGLHQGLPSVATRMRQRFNAHSRSMRKLSKAGGRVWQQVHARGNRVTQRKRGSMEISSQFKGLGNQWLRVAATIDYKSWWELPRCFGSLENGTGKHGALLAGRVAEDPHAVEEAKRLRQTIFTISAVVPA